MTIAPPTLPRDIFDRLRALVYQWTGMSLGENKRYFIERRVADRVARTGCTDARHYLMQLSTDPAERQALINAFTINETYFYREAHQLSALSGQILPELVERRRPGDLVRILSLPCSTGEEAYSIALWLLENWPLVDAYNIEIVGADIDTAALSRAAEGRFAARSLARLPDKVREDYFEPESGNGRKIIDDLRESVRFAFANIVDGASIGALGAFDVILCRNLLIYFDDASRTAAAKNLHASLTPGGFLCLGHSESMARTSNCFSLVRLDDAIVYRKR